MRTDKYFIESLERIKTLLSRLNFKGTVYLFGSSVREDYKKTSDIDLAVSTNDKKIITLLKYELEELPIPYKIDLLDLEEVGEELKKEILNQGILIWKN
jgi:predicted nucleotidyltransferase